MVTLGVNPCRAYLVEAEINESRSPFSRQSGSHYFFSNIGSGSSGAAVIADICLHGWAGEQSVALAEGNLANSGRNEVRWLDDGNVDGSRLIQCDSAVLAPPPSPTHAATTRQCRWHGGEARQHGVVRWRPPRTSLSRPSAMCRSCLQFVNGRFVGVCALRSSRACSVSHMAMSRCSPNF